MKIFELLLLCATLIMWGAFAGILLGTALEAYGHWLDRDKDIKR